MIGQQVGNYKVHSQIGAGGMGEVFLAEHTTIGTRVAIKVLMAGISKDKEQVDRFFNEARAVNKVRHAGPVKIFDVGYHNDAAGVRQAYLVMEFLDGESLAGRIKRLGTLPGDQVADIGRQIAGVLDAVHSAGITHRDLKPDNIFLIPDHELPSGERVKVLDFGIAKLTGTMSGGGPQTKGTMGTPAYMAPEQWNNASSVDGRADTYSLGCVMFEMAVGKPPFPSQSIGEACNHHLNSKPPRASEHMHNVPVEFDNLVDRMLSKQSDQRPTIKEVGRAFNDLQQSGATHRWTAAMVVGVAQTMGPTENTPAPYNPAYGSQPNLNPGSQPGIHYGHQPGLQNPFSQSQQYPAQSGSQPYIPQQSGSQPYIPPQHNTPPPGQHFTPQHHTPQHHTPQHNTPPPQHHTPQHHTPQHHTPQHHTPPPGQQHFTPQHPTPAPGTFPPQTQPKSKKGLIFALVGVAVVGGGVAVAVTQMGGGEKPGPGSGSDPGSGTAIVTVPPDAPTKAPDDAAKVTVDAPGPSLRDQILAKNPFVNRYGVRVLTSQIDSKEYELVMGAKPPPANTGKPDDPVHSVTQQEATEFCTKIGARLPTSAEWTQAAKGAWGIAVGAVAGPLQEWTSTVQDELAVARGGHDKMPQDQLDKHAKQKPPYFLQKEVSGPGVDRKVASSTTIGFRCVDAPRVPAPAKAGTGSAEGSGSAVGAGSGSAAGSGAGSAVASATLTLPGNSLPARLSRTWIHSSTTKVDGKTITLATSMTLTATATEVKGTSTTFASIGLSNYTSVVSVSGKPVGTDSMDFSTSPVRADKLPGDLGWCPSSGRLKVADDPRRKGHYKLSGTLRLGGTCGGTEYYAYVSK